MKCNRSRMVDVGWCLAPLAWFLGACSGNTLSLGEEVPAPGAPAGSRCAAGAAVEGTVIVYDQPGLDALAGCESIGGNLEIAQFERADLGPLASLRRVGGGFYVGSTPSTEAYIEVAGGWLESFEGVEALEQVGELVIDNVNAPSLLPFRSLRLLEPAQYGGLAQLTIQNAHHLVDLRGLEAMKRATSVLIVDNEALESLEGLSLDARVDVLDLVDCPRLSNLDALASTNGIASLALIDTGIRDLTALSALSIGSIDLERNAQLVDASALPLHITDFTIVDNPQLDGTLFVSYPADVFVTDNPELDRIALRQRRSVHDGWGDEALQTSIQIGYNSSLSSVDLGELTRCGRLMLERNDNLSRLEMPALEGAVALRVVGNPRLSTAELADVEALDRELSDNAD